MKFYKIKIIPVSFFPFHFLSVWKRDFLLFIEYLKVKHKFKKRNWNDDQVWQLTSFCCCIEDAVQRLCYELTKNTKLHPKLKKLIYDGYERHWE